MHLCPFCLVPLNEPTRLVKTCFAAVCGYVCTRPPGHKGMHVACCPPAAKHIIGITGVTDMLTFEIKNETIKLL